MVIKGKVHKFSDDINTDDIIAAKYLVSTDAQELGKHCMETINPNFSQAASPGDIIIAGRNFGCGSSREHAPVAIKAAGISYVIAESFARIFFRNSINIGLPLIESKEAAERVRGNDVLKIDTDKGSIKNVSRKESYKFEKYPPFMQKIVRAGGLVESIKKRK